MSTVTLEQIQTRQAELATMISQYITNAAGEPRTIEIVADDIELRPGEHFAGAVLDEQGEHEYYLVLMAARPDKRLTWSDAKQWAEAAGGALPTRQEAALLFANCKPHLEAFYHWTGESLESDASYAWGCYFGLGNQIYTDKSFEGRAVAVRRV